MFIDQRTPTALLFVFSAAPRIALGMSTGVCSDPPAYIFTEAAPLKKQKEKEAWKSATINMPSLRDSKTSLNGSA